jgi:hypothetical protein
VPRLGLDILRLRYHLMALYNRHNTKGASQSLQTSRTTWKEAVLRGKSPRRLEKAHGIAKKGHSQHGW